MKLKIIQLVLALLAFAARADTAFEIHGSLTLPDDGCDKARVFLCDGSGEPLGRLTGRPFTESLGTTNEPSTMNWWFAVPDPNGQFRFTNVPAGKYIVVAQAWNSPIQPTNFIKFRCETIHLLGRAEVAVPGSNSVTLTPPGERTIQFDQQFGNDDGLLILGTRPQRGDAILGWLGWGTNFLTHLIGYNMIPGGRTTVHGLPEDAYASIFMNDNSPGFGSIHLAPGIKNPVKMPIVAGWSDGYKVPPTNLVWLVELIETNKFNVEALLGAHSRTNLNFIERTRARARELNAVWDKQIVLPTGQTVTGVDFMTAAGYARLRGH